MQWDVYPYLFGRQEPQTQENANKTRYSLWTMVGLRLGTADADKKDVLGYYIPARYQLGTGTTDPILGLRFQATRLNGISPGFMLIYTFNSENKTGYERSDTVYIKADLTYLAFEKFRLNPGVSFIVVPRHDRQDGVIQAGTRGENYYLEFDTYYLLSATVNPYIFIKYLYHTEDVSSKNSLRLTAGIGIMLRF